MQRCRTCVTPITRPDIHFDETGECSACRAHKARPEIDWGKRKEELLKLLELHGGRCIVPSSGGKDSTYQVLKLKELGADPVVVTARTCHLTEIGRKNIDNLARFAPTVEYTPNMSIRRVLNREGLRLVGDISWPEHASIFSVPFRAAVELNIPLIFYGENPQNAYGGPVGSEKAKQMTRRWTQEYGGYLGLRASDFVGVDGIMAPDMLHYELPDQEEMDRIGVEAHFLGQYLPWDSRGNATLAAENGMLQQLPTPINWWVFENCDNASTGIHDFFMYLKYGFGRGCSQISVDIRNGIVTREFALDWIERHDGAYPHEYMGVKLEDILESIEMNEREFHDLIRGYTAGWVSLKELSQS